MSFLSKDSKVESSKDGKSSMKEGGLVAMFSLFEEKALVSFEVQGIGFKTTNILHMEPRVDNDACTFSNLIFKKIIAKLPVNMKQ